MTDRFPPPKLLDLMRGREGDLAPATLRILDAAIKDGSADEMPADVQAAALAATAALIVMLTPPSALNRRSRDAEGQLRALIFAHHRRVKDMGVDLAAMQSDGAHEAIGRVFGEAWRDLMERRPIPKKFVDAGCATPDHFRKVLMGSELHGGMSALFESVFGEQTVDYLALQLAAIDASAMLSAAAYDINGHDDEGFADLLVEEFRSTLLRSITYWRAKRGN